MRRAKGQYHCYQDADLVVIINYCLQMGSIVAVQCSLTIDVPSNQFIYSHKYIRLIISKGDTSKADYCCFVPLMHTHYSSVSFIRSFARLLVCSIFREPRDCLWLCEQTILRANDNKMHVCGVSWHLSMTSLRCMCKQFGCIK